MSTASEQEKTLKKTAKSAKTARPAAEQNVRATKAAKSARADKPAAEPKAKAAKTSKADKPAAEPKAKAAKATKASKVEKDAAEPKANAAKTSKADKPAAEPKAKAKTAKTSKADKPAAEPKAKAKAAKTSKADKPAAEPKAKAKAAKTSKADKPVAEPKAKAAKATKASKAEKPAAEPKAKAKAAKTSKADKPVAEPKAKAGGKSRAKVAQVFAEPSKGIEEQFKEITLLNEKERYEMMSLLQKQNPNPKSELEFSNTFELLCAVVLSAQATDASVNKATPALFAKAPDARSMAALGADGIAPFIQSIGLWKNKAKFLAQLSAVLVDKYDGQVPDNFDELTALPGVGSKTARVVLNVAFGQPFIAVDTHVFRVATRTGLCIGKCPGQVEERIAPLVAEPFLKEAHHYLLLHGRYNCTARNFEGHCEKCVIAKYCKHNYEH
ncbi:MULTISPECIES: endonuclease III [unclassified Anaerobiospirillum]|uniref:endonuclease III n=1 Tax=unclassified Anaerobiospirillum TaxID=2647410 RepID=UPI001FF2911E|nr:MULTISPECIES: endonuclease III [unclassified Anaerobiospirillum]MCK0535044.1 endonuclease III [Anaerobiospirillum sp. NML120511]MCK0540169.1 endonuclease III [Anaerobiospirillum sp. NML02-A-032]